MHIKAFRAVFPNLEYVTSNDSFFGSVKEDYPEYVNSGFFSKSESPALYIYKIINGSRTYTGLIASVDVKYFMDGPEKQIYGHENVIREKQQRQIELLLRRKAIVKPVLLTYQISDTIKALQEQIIEEYTPDFDIHFESQGAHHLIYTVKHPELIQLFAEQFSQINKTYIADGHHRSMSSLRLFLKSKTEEQRQLFGTVMVALFSTDQIEILDFNRVVDLQQNVSDTMLMAKLSRLFDITPMREPVKPAHKFEIVMILNREYFSLQWKAELLHQQDRENILLDCALLDELVLEDILGITDVKNDSRVSYIEGPKGIQGLYNKVVKNDRAVGFCLFPVQIEEMIEVADQNKYLPAKSTWFEPRMKNGLVVFDYSQQL